MLPRLPMITRDSLGSLSFPLFFPVSIRCSTSCTLSSGCHKDTVVCGSLVWLQWGVVRDLIPVSQLIPTTNDITLSDCFESSYSSLYVQRCLDHTAALLCLPMLGLLKHVRCAQPATQSAEMRRATWASSDNIIDGAYCQRTVLKQCKALRRRILVVGV